MNMSEVQLQNKEKIVGIRFKPEEDGYFINFQLVILN